MSDLARSVHRHPLPSRALLAGHEVLLWVAFGSHHDTDHTGATAFRDMWGCGPEPRAGGNALEIALQEACGTLPRWEAETIANMVDFPSWLVRARRQATTVMDRLRLSATDALSVFNIQRQYFFDRTKMVSAAKEEVVDALVLGQMQVLASPADPSSPTVALGPSRVVPADFFATRGVRLELDNTIRIPCGSGFADARFRRSEIVSRWANAHKGQTVEVPGNLGRKARKPSGLDYRGPDAELVSQMRALILSGEARNPTDAARMLAGRAPGASEDSKVKRLLLRYKEAPSSVQP